SSASGTRAPRTRSTKTSTSPKSDRPDASMAAITTTGTIGGASFVQNLSKIYLTYTGTFVVFVLALGVLEALGVSNRVIGYLYIFLTIGVYALIGVLSRTHEVTEYYVAGRVVPAFYNGMATGADWMSAASFIGMAGSLY